MLWIGSAIPSIWTNIYEDYTKYLFSDASSNMTTQSFHLKERTMITIITSLLYIVLINTLAPLLINTIWNKFKGWIRTIDVDQLVYNSLAPLQPIASRSTSS